MNILSSHVFQIKPFIIQDCSIAQFNLLEEDDNLVVNEYIDFRRKASKLRMPLETNIPLALARLDTPNIFRYALLYATLILEKVLFYIVSRIKDSRIPCRNSNIIHAILACCTY